MASWHPFRGRKPIAGEPVMAGAPPRASSKAATPGKTSRIAGAKKGRFKIGDAVLTGLGLGLGAASFTFPWYVFFNQEQFGVRVVNFEDVERDSDLSGPFYTHQVEWKPRRLSPEEVAELPLDFVPTGTVRDRLASPDSTGSVQPFPKREPLYALVHVANGRAMIQDARGFWVVERGSILPDNTRVVAIEQQSGKWVLRTSDDRVVEIAN